MMMGMAGDFSFCPFAIMGELAFFRGRTAFAAGGR